jgi:thiol-disulfide isomerase/thioredoxin
MIWRIGQPDIELLLRNAQPARPPELIGQERTTDTLSLIGEPAPDFNLPSLDDTSVRLADFKGSVVVLDFWATWCPPCRKSLPHLQRLSQDAALQKKGLKVLAVNLKEPKDQVAEFQKQNGYNIPVALDGNGATAKKYLVQGIPTTVIIDAAGLIKGTFVGFGADSEKQLDAAINAVLGVR